MDYAAICEDALLAPFEGLCEVCFELYCEAESCACCGAHHATELSEDENEALCARCAEVAQ